MRKFKFENHVNPKIIKIMALAIILTVSCVKSPGSAIEPASSSEQLKMDWSKINMAEELAKIDTMLKADSVNATIAHESYLHALDMIENDRIIFAELFYKRALAHEPESHFLLNELIKILLKQNKTEKAFSLLKLAVQSPKATAEDFLFIARLYKENQNLDSSVHYYKKATDRMSGNMGVLYEYAQLLEFSRNLPELRRVYDILLAELDYPPRLLEKQILLYQIVGVSDSATAYLLGEAFRANGIAYAEFGYFQAEILSSLKKYNEANEVLLTIFYMHPSNEFKSKIALKIAYNYELMDSITIAVVWLEQLLAQEPENHIAMNNLGYMLIDRSIDVNKGLSLVEKALSYLPDEASYLDSKAWGLYKSGKYEESLEIFEKLEASGMNVNELWLHLAKVCEALKLNERAKEYRTRIRN
jgi:tetratricopeptide (TPR) repeat protein